MTAPRTYLDWNATAPLRPEARAAMLSALDLAGNPSSVHAEGRAARAVVDGAREKVAALVGAAPSEVIFTSGATEANATVMAGGWSSILAAGIEHDSVLQPARAGGSRVIELAVGSDGRLDVGALADRVLRGDDFGAKPLLSLQAANNETGIIQPVAKVAAFARAHGVAVHTDAVQACGRIAVDMRALGVDYLSLSAHKIGGPKGVGALVIRDGAPPLPPLIAGGGQERRRRAGTENVAGIAGFGAAAEVAVREIARIDRQRLLRDRLEHHILSMTPDAVILGADAERLANTTCVALPGRAAETLVIRLDLAGIAVSAGSACSSGKVGTSHVLRAMGITPEIARGAIRISIGAATTEADIGRFLAAWETITRTAAKAA